jgi:hypothetical protein
VGGWRNLCNDEIHNLYTLPFIIRVIKRRVRWARHVGRMKEMRNTYKIFVGIYEGKRPLGILGHKYIKMDLK